MKCKSCGQELGEEVKICPICRMDQTGDILLNEEVNKLKEEPLMPDVASAVPPNTQMFYEIQEQETQWEKQKSRLIAGLLQLFFGGFGLGRFYLGYTGVAVGQLCTLPLLGIGYIWGFIDGVLILCGQLDLDADGVPLK